MKLAYEKVTVFLTFSIFFLIQVEAAEGQTSAGYTRLHEQADIGVARISSSSHLPYSLNFFIQCRMKKNLSKREKEREEIQ